MPGPPGELKSGENFILKNAIKSQPVNGHVIKLFLESEFQHKRNKQRKKREFSAKSCSFLSSNRFNKYNYLNTTQNRTKENLDRIVIVRTGTYL